MLLRSENRIKISLFILGFTSIITQIILLREFLSIFNGNELITGIILANWMLLTGLGSYLGKLLDKHINNLNFIYAGHFMMAFLPIIILFLAYYFRNNFYPPGQIINIAGVFFNSFLLLTPFCLVSGIIFPVLASLLSEQSKSNIINKAYSIEAFGSVAGGILFNFLMIFVLKTFFSLTILMMLNLAAAITGIFLSGKRIFSYILTLLTMLITVFIAFSDIDLKALQYLYPGQEIVHFEDTPYSKIVVTRTEDQYNFFENGTFLFSEDNTIMMEENVHYAMAQHSAPENVLLISGGISGSINEILKYKIKSLDYIEQNPKIIEIGELYTSNISHDRRITIINQDARLFLKTNRTKKYDVVLINLPDPTSAQINRFYTLEFFEELKMDLNESAVICISLTATSNYMGEQSRKINSSVYITLKLLFQNVIIMPGGLNYFIASDGVLSRSINELLELKSIKNIYLNTYYLNDKKIEQESKLLEEMLSEKVAINYDFKPVVYLYQLDYWLSQFDLNYLILFIIILFPVTYSLLKMNFINYGIFVTGISASAIEVILIIAFQVIYGYTYQMMGILITFFMAGLFVGSVFVIKKIKVFIRTYSLVQYFIGIFSILVALVLYFLRSAYVDIFIVHITFILLIFIIGILTGLQFSLASRLRTMSIIKIAASTYASDLLGAAIGAVLVAAFLIPYLGIIKVALLISVLNFVTGLYILLKLKKS